MAEMKTPANPEKKNRGMGYYVTGVAVTAALVGGLFARQACQAEGVQKECAQPVQPAAGAAVETPACPEPKQCPDRPACEDGKACAPVASKTDNVCDVERGESDMRSPNYDPACNRCGDGVAQEWEYASWAPPEDLKGKVECDVDFHCGNGKVDRRATYATLVPVMSQDGKETIGYKVETVEVTESCRESDTANYCAADCPKQGGGGHRPDTEPEVAVVQPVQVPTGGPCPPEVTTSPASSGVRREVMSAVLGQGNNVKTQLGGEGAARVAVHLGVSPSGVPTVEGGTAKCNVDPQRPDETGSPCPNSSFGGAELRSWTGLNLGGMTTAAPSGSGCRWTIRVTVP